MQKTRVSTFITLVLVFVFAQVLHGRNFSAYPSSLAFQANTGGANPPAQVVNVVGAPDRDWTAAAGAAWIQLSAAQGRAPSKVQVSVVINGLAAGVYNARITFTSGRGVQQVVDVTLTLSASAPVAPLAILTTSLPLGTVGTAYSATLSASGGTGPYTWTVVGGSLPPGLGLNPGGISGTPAAAGLFSFTVQAGDSGSPPQAATTNLSIQIADGAQARTVLWSADFETGDLSQWYAPSTGPTGDFGGTQGIYNSATVQVTRSYAHSGSSSAALTTTTPPESAARLVRWRELQSYPALYYSAWYYFPQVYTPTLYWNVFAWDSYRPATNTADPFFILNVGNRSNGAMYFYLFDWQRRLTYSQSVKDIPVGRWIQVEAFYQCAGDGSGRVTFWQDGTLLLDVPNVQTRYADGNCQWSLNNYSDGLTPAAATLYVDDASIAAGGALPPPGPTPTPTPSTPSPLVITTASLPSGTRGAAYSAGLGASGGTAPYTWTLSGGQLPPGLSLSGQGSITGTPSNSGLYPFSVQVRDSAAAPQSATANFSIQVAEPAPAASGTTYYVDSVAGNDANSGTSESAPWRTLTPVRNRTFRPGETVRFKRGGSWTGPLVAKDSGVSGSPITFSDYGSGPLPVFSNPGVTYGHAVEIRASWVVVENLLARDAHEAAIFIAAGANNNIVRNCELTQAGAGVTVNGQYNLITGNYAHDLTMIVDTPGGDDDYGAVGFWLNAPNNEVSYNRAVNCKAHSYDYGSDGGVVEIYGNGDNSYIHHNWGETSNGFMEVGGGTAQNVRLAYNVAYNNGSLSCLHTGGNFTATVTNLRIENNTVVQTSGAGSLFQCLSTFSSNTMSLRNNIFYTSASVYTNGGFTHENNIYYMLGSAGVGYSLGPNERIADPLFVNVSGKDFHLRSGSPAIDAGRNLGYTSDMDGGAVPQGSAPDAGAYEYGSTPQTSAPSAPAPAPTLNFTASPASIQAGQTSTLTWSSTDATGCTASGAWSGSKPASGSQAVSPSQTATYTLACSGAGGSVTRSATVTVTAPSNSPAPNTAQVIWSAGMEANNMNEWYLDSGGGEFNSGGGTSEAVCGGSYPAHSGNCSARLGIYNTTGARLFRWKEPRQNREAYYSAWYYIPVQPTVGSWWQIFQFKSRSTSNQVDPFWYLEVTPSLTWKLTWWNGLTVEGPHQGEQGGRAYLNSSPVPIGRWFHIEAFLRQSNGFDGRVTIWIDGQQIFDQTNVRTTYSNCNYNSWCGSNEWSVNNYGQSVSPNPLYTYVDDAAISLSRIGP